MQYFALKNTPGISTPGSKAHECRVTMAQLDGATWWRFCQLGAYLMCRSAFNSLVVPCCHFRNRISRVLSFPNSLLPLKMDLDASPARGQCAANGARAKRIASMPNVYFEELMGTPHKAPALAEEMLMGWKCNYGNCLPRPRRELRGTRNFTAASWAITRCTTSCY